MYNFLRVHALNVSIGVYCSRRDTWFERLNGHRSAKQCQSFKSAIPGALGTLPCTKRNKHPFIPIRLPTFPPNHRQPNPNNKTSHLSSAPSQCAKSGLALAPPATKKCSSPALAPQKPTQATASPAPHTVGVKPRAATRSQRAKQRLLNNGMVRGGRRKRDACRAVTRERSRVRRRWSMRLGRLH